MPILPAVGLETVRFGFFWSQARRSLLVRRSGPSRCQNPGVTVLVVYTSSQKMSFAFGVFLGQARNSPVLSSPEYQPFAKVSVI